MAQEKKGRPWDWTPSPMANRFMSIMLQTPLLHRALGSMMLITFTGRKSGKSYTTPVGFLREGECVTITSKRFRTWWHNFEEPAPVKLLIHRKTYQGEAQTISDEGAVVPILAHVLEQQPYMASFYGVEIGEDGKPNIQQVRETASKLVIIQVTLKN